MRPSLPAALPPNYACSPAANGPYGSESEERGLPFESELLAIGAIGNENWNECKQNQPTGGFL